MDDTIFDFDIDTETRLRTLEQIQDRDLMFETITKLCGMYMFSGTKLLEGYLFDIATQSNIPPYFRLECANTLEGCNYTTGVELGYQALDIVIPTLQELDTPPQIEAICKLMRKKEYRDKAKSYFCHLINNSALECEFRYKTILGLEVKEVDKYFLKEACLSFLYNQNNMTTYRVLASQYLLRHKLGTEKEVVYIEKALLGFAEDNQLDYNLRADATDVLLQFGSQSHRARARELIILLGRERDSGRTVFENAQNVHTEAIEESSLKIIEALSELSLMAIEGSPITFSYVEKQIKELAKEKSQDEQELIETALTRIHLDRAIYTSFSCTLAHILLKLWSYIHVSPLGQEHSSELKRRLLEELMDMAGICSTGYAYRLCNVLSGYDENLTVRISWEEQIIANFAGRLNARIRRIPEEDTIEAESETTGIKCIVDRKRSSTHGYEYRVEFKGDKRDSIANAWVPASKLPKGLREDFNIEYKDELAVEMATVSSDFKSRQNFLRFLRENFLSIRDELHQEFHEHITDAEFDLYIRKALMTYEGEI